MIQDIPEGKRNVLYLHCGMCSDVRQTCPLLLNYMQKHMVSTVRKLCLKKFNYQFFYNNFQTYLGIQQNNKCNDTSSILGSWGLTIPPKFQYSRLVYKNGHTHAIYIIFLCTLNHLFIVFLNECWQEKTNIFRADAIFFRLFWSMSGKSRETESRDTEIQHYHSAWVSEAFGLNDKDPVQ